MAFFNEISKKLTNTGQEAVQKAKDVAEITKVNSQIADFEKKNDELKLEIGKIVMIQSVEETTENLKKRMEEKQDKIAEYILKIREVERQIQEGKERITVLKGITKCPNCGNEVQNGLAFCGKCGTKLEEIKKVENQKVCPKCGEKIPEDSAFCTACGTKVESEKRFCVQCGNELMGEDVFCPNCGTKNDGEDGIHI